MGGGQLLQDQQQDGIDSGVGDKRNTQMGSEGEALRRRLDLLEAAADAERRASDNSLSDLVKGLSPKRSAIKRETASAPDHWVGIALWELGFISDLMSDEVRQELERLAIVQMFAMGMSPQYPRSDGFGLSVANLFEVRFELHVGDQVMLIPVAAEDDRPLIKVQEVHGPIRRWLASPASAPDKVRLDLEELEGLANLEALATASSYLSGLWHKTEDSKSVHSMPPYSSDHSMTRSGATVLAVFFAVTGGEITRRFSYMGGADPHIFVSGGSNTPMSGARTRCVAVYTGGVGG